MVFDALKEAEKNGINVKYLEEKDKKVVELTGFRFKIKALKTNISKIVAEAKKSLDFDLLYISSVDKEILESNKVLEPMRKEIEISIDIEKSKTKTYHLDFPNFNRLTVTTCSIDKYYVIPRVVHKVEDLQL